MMASEPWHADILISEDIVSECIQQQFPMLMPLKTIRCVGEG